ncbi:hypothetical protein CT19425_U610031 [Cupriavidus taiwanensis]|uniref:Uncharacterized protein n=1 Tax=Cupriavidus taiwanensis TaxID=164546 RepID=A0A375IBJ7_9BURK|nr:hypothetical protein CT19425_U610031 [Cupriavidus taiwanensis]
MCRARIGRSESGKLPMQLGSPPERRVYSFNEFSQKFVLTDCLPNSNRAAAYGQLPIT